MTKQPISGQCHMVNFPAISALWPILQLLSHVIKEFCVTCCMIVDTMGLSMWLYDVIMFDWPWQNESFLN